ncbi:MAG: S41 family peptidase [Mucilaginibacter sp.]
MKKVVYLVILLTAGVLSACKKESKPPVTPPTDTVVVIPPTRFELTKDSIFLYAKESYLWNEAIPDSATFKPRKFTGSNELAALQKEVDAISQYKINPSTGKPFEYYAPQPGASKYSFIDDGSTSGGLGGAAGDFGFEPRYAFDDNLYIKYVYPNSPADNAGIKRGYKVVRLNGHTDFDPSVSANIDAIVDGFYSEDHIDITLEKPDGTNLDASFNTAEYTINPVLTYKVIPAGSKKVAYMVFNSFTSLANSKPKIDQAFNYFTANGATDLVVDLRYNGGGYTATAEYISDLIVPAAKSGTLMYTYFFNQSMQDGIFPLLNKNVFDNQLAPGDFKPENNRTLFDKEGSFNPSKVVFILTGGSASASELLINNLLPHMDVKIVGEPSYGKPVGFFAIPIDKYELYLAQFSTKNSQNKGEYYAGMVPGSSDFPGKETDDDVTKDFGNPEELSLAAALNYISTGDFVAVSNRTKKINTTRVLSLDQLRVLGLKTENPKRFKGMIRNEIKKH